MADPVQYTGATYNADLYKLPTESMADYMIRLAKLRASGVLGGGGMLNVAEQPTPTVVTPAAQELGVLKKNISGNNYEVPTEPEAPATYSQANNFGYIDPNTASQIGGLFGPLGSAIGYGLASWNNANAVERAQDLAGITPEDRSGTWFKDLTESIGTKDINNRTYEVSIGGVISDTPSIVERLFSGAVPNVSTSLTPREANLRANMAGYNTAVATPTAAPQYMFDFGPTITPDNPAYIQDTGSGITTSGSYNDSGDWSWSGTDFSAPSTTADGNDWSSW